MTTEYARVIVGERVSPLSGGDDDDEPLLVNSSTPTTTASNPRSQPTAYNHAAFYSSGQQQPQQRPNVVVYGTQGGISYANTPVHPHPPHHPFYAQYPPPGYAPYGAYPPPPPPPPPPGWLIMEAEPGEECALFGCLFSWIPFVGIVTFIANFDAPPHTRRGFWARWAMIISSLVILALIVLGPWFYVW